NRTSPTNEQSNKLLKFKTLTMIPQTHLKLLRTFVALLLIPLTFSAQNYKPVGDKIKTKWAEQIDVNAVLPEYPRPILKREQWKNLNGLWDYAIEEVGKSKPSKADGKILVPFAVESAFQDCKKELEKSMSYGMKLLLLYQKIGMENKYSFTLELWIGKPKYG